MWDLHFLRRDQTHTTCRECTVLTTRPPGKSSFSFLSSVTLPLILTTLLQWRCTMFIHCVQKGKPRPKVIQWLNGGAAASKQPLWLPVQSGQGNFETVIYFQKGQAYRSTQRWKAKLLLKLARPYIPQKQSKQRSWGDSTHGGMRLPFCKEQERG